MCKEVGEVGIGLDKKAEGLVSRYRNERVVSVAKGREAVQSRRRRCQWWLGESSW